MAFCEENSLLTCRLTVKEGQIHPLLIDHVVEKMFGFIGNSSYSGKSDILRLREVCKKWKHIGTRVFEKLNPSKLYFSPSNAEQLETFVIVWSETDDLLRFQTYDLDQTIISENPQLFHEFMKRFSPFIPNLRINIEDLLMTYYDPAIFQEMDLRNLKELSFHFIFTRYTKHTTPSTPDPEKLKKRVNLFESILKSCNNLHKFSFDCCMRNVYSTELNAILVNSVIPNLSKNVQDLTLTVSIQDDTLKKFQNLGLGLRALQIALIGSYLSSDYLLDFIDTQRNSLIELGVSGDSREEEGGQVPQLSFPICPKLKALDLKRANAATFSCLEAFPSLEKLRFEGTIEIREYLAPSASEEVLQTPRTSLKDLTIGYRIADSILITKLAKSFPLLIKLVIKLRNRGESVELLQIVSQEMPNLEELHILYAFGFEEEKDDSELLGKTMVYHVQPDF